MALFLPNIFLDSVLDIEAEFLKNNGIQGLVLDVDNTLTLHGDPTPADGVPEWLDMLQMAGIQLMIVSNNSAKRVKPFADKLHLPFVSRGCKPLTFGITRACKRFGLSKEQVAIVGDQIFTDITAGNLKRIFSILVSPMQVEDGPFFRLKRSLEQPILRRYHKKRRRL